MTAVHLREAVRPCKALVVSDTGSDGRVLQGPQIGSYPQPGETFVVTHLKRLPSGRLVDKGREVTAWPVVELAAFRCQHCEHDVVWDQRTDEWWDLDTSDYGDSGSADPRLF